MFTFMKFLSVAGLTPAMRLLSGFGLMPLRFAYGVARPLMKLVAVLGVICLFGFYMFDTGTDLGAMLFDRFLFVTVFMFGMMGVLDYKLGARY